MSVVQTEPVSRALRIRCQSTTFFRGNFSFHVHFDLQSFEFGTWWKEKAPICSRKRHRQLEPIGVLPQTFKNLDSHTSILPFAMPYLIRLNVLAEKDCQ